MDRKDRFQKVIEERGFNSVVEVMTKVEAYILKDKGKAMEKVSKNKNYYAMIEGKTRDFPREYILGLEQCTVCILEEKV